MDHAVIFLDQRWPNIINFETHCEHVHQEESEEQNPCASMNCIKFEALKGTYVSPSLIGSRQEHLISSGPPGAEHCAGLRADDAMWQGGQQRL